MADMPPVKNSPSVSMAATTNLDSEAPIPRQVISQQPQTSIKYRYPSEKGSHGFIYSKMYEKSKNKKNAPKKYPEVKVENYHGKVHIRASLVQEKSNEDHLHFLSSKGEIKVDVSNNIARFDKLSIECRKKEDVNQYLRQQHPGWDEVKIKKHKEELNMNVVRIKFSAFCTETGKEICDPVYSNPIRNKKSENCLNIIGIFECTVKEKADFFVFASPLENCTKTDSKPEIVKVRMYTLSENGHVSWKAYAEISTMIHSNIIGLRFPPNNNVGINKNVSAYVQLVRSSDEAVSEPVLFQYTPVYQSQAAASNNAGPTPAMSPDHAHDVRAQNVASGSSSLVMREQNIEEEDGEKLHLNQNLQHQSLELSKEGINQRSSRGRASCPKVWYRPYYARYQTFKTQPVGSSSPTEVQEFLDKKTKDASSTYYCDQQRQNALPDSEEVPAESQQDFDDFIMSPDDVSAQNVASGSSSSVMQEQNIDEGENEKLHLKRNWQHESSEQQVSQVDQRSTRGYSQAIYQSFKTPLFYPILSQNDPLLSEGSPSSEEAKIIRNALSEPYLDKQRQNTLPDSENYAPTECQQDLDDFLRDAILGFYPNEFNLEPLPESNGELFEELDYNENDTLSSSGLSNNITSAQNELESGNNDKSNGPKKKKYY